MWYILHVQFYVYDIQSAYKKLFIPARMMTEEENAKKKERGKLARFQKVHNNADHFRR